MNNISAAMLSQIKGKKGGGGGHNQTITKAYNTHIHKVSIIHKLCLTMEESFDFHQYSENHLKN